MCSKNKLNTFNKKLLLLAITFATTTVRALWTPLNPLEIPFEIYILSSHGTVYQKNPNEE